MFNIPKIQHSKNPISIDILLSVIDNFGDIGFAGELMMAYRCLFLDIRFRVFTDAPEKVREFFMKNKDDLPQYEILSLDSFLAHHPSQIIFSLFHVPVPMFSDNRKRLVLRFDYCSFDPQWVVQNAKEHIASDNCTEIREIIPSPLPEGGGLLRHNIAPVSRERWWKNMRLKETNIKKSWIFMFIYGSTTERIIWDSFDDSSQIFLFCPIPVKRQNIITLPLLSIHDFYSLLLLSDFCIVRGEVSFVQALSSGKPFLWDMYKEKGGFFFEQSRQFLDYGCFDPQYQDLHNVLNGQKPGSVSYEDILRTSKNFPYDTFKRLQNIKNLAEETKKYIDRFYFSL